MSGLRNKPELVVFAGPNGSGKSTLTELLKPNMPYVNADEIKKNLKCTDMEAAQIAEGQREAYVKLGTGHSASSKNGKRKIFIMSVLTGIRKIFCS